jgi:NAD(P)-dependent dehydrogenase (short-subunit alcohol dehydrogenase family)/acyl carrier protein
VSAAAILIARSIPAASAAPVREASPARAPAEPSEGVDEDGSDVTESVIRIIMEATGYDRDEIEPEMDLREDLAIRSSRLPVIMDALEEFFGIRIEIEEFMDVRTIADISEKIAEMVPEAKGGTTGAASQAKPSSKPEREAEAPLEKEKEPIKRIVFREVPLQPGDGERIELDPSDGVVTVGPETGSGLTGRIGDLFREEFGIEPVAVARKTDPSATGEAAFDSAAGLVVVIEDSESEIPQDMQGISDLLSGLFVTAKAFLDSPSKKFLFLVHKSGDGHGPAHVLVQGLTGMLLSLAHEAPSVRFRTILLEKDEDLEAALRGAMDRSQPVIQMIRRGEDLLTLGGVAACVDFPETRSLKIGRGDVVVLSGGGYGVTNHLARALVPLGCRIVFLGRTRLDPNIDFRRLLEPGDDPDAALAEEVERATAGSADRDPEREKAEAAKALEIIRNVEALRGQGVEASYYRCDVTDAESVNRVIEEIADRFGRVDGVVHGAGVIRDRPFKEMTEEDFSWVTDVKLLGAWNLYRASIGRGLKFFVSLSSGACIQGNPGQSNYAAGNRAMSALMDLLGERNESVLFKALMLPPIEGTGMAEDPEIRALMKRMNASYVHADELAGLFTVELMLAPASDRWVLFMRSLPDLKTVLLDPSEETAGSGLRAATVEYESADVPMIDAVTVIDLKEGVLEASRTFSLEKDLWMEDHRPFKFMKHPIVSAIMAVETFMEASSLLHPHLTVQRLEDVEFEDLVECAPGEVRESVVTCRTRELMDRSVRCEAVIETRDVSPSGKPMDRMCRNFRAVVVMGADRPSPAADYPGFPVKRDRFDSRPMDRAEAEKKYEGHSRLAGRYRVIEEMYGSSPDAAAGRIVYKRSNDFAPPLKSLYRYSPYLFEALLHTAIFHVFMRDETDERVFIPVRLDELVSFRRCEDGESVEVEGRLKDRDDKSLVWDARALDRKGRVLMYLRGMEFRCFTG